MDLFFFVGRWEIGGMHAADDSVSLPVPASSSAPLSAAGAAGQPAARAPRQERGRKRREEILDAAEQLMLEVGPAAASIQDIAKRAGSSVGSIYHFFPTKEAILAALFTRHEAEVEEVVARICGVRGAAPGSVRVGAEQGG